MDGIRSRYVMVDGIRTHYLEAGDGSETVVLLHAGGFGEDAELSWEPNIEPLAARYRVLAPDWLGFGGTDKLRDFVSGSQRMVKHMTRFLEIMCVDQAHFGGVSMGGTMLLRILGAQTPGWRPLSAFVASGGGFVPMNDARQVLLDYDQSFEAMRACIRVGWADPKWAADDAFVKRRWESSLRPGAWEFSASARFKGPSSSIPPSEFGQNDETKYENIEVPVLYTAGAQDPLRERGYADEIAERTPQGTAKVFDGCGHMVNFDADPEWNTVVLDFLDGLPRP